MQAEIESNPIRAQLLFFTSEVVGGSNTAFSILAGLVENNDFLQIDRHPHTARSLKNARAIAA